MRPIRKTLAGTDSQTVPIPLDHHLNPFTVSLATKFGASVANVTVQFTFDDVFATGYNPATGVWFNHTAMAALTSDTGGSLISPVTAVRLSRNSGTDPVDFIVMQAGIHS